MSEELCETCKYFGEKWFGPHCEDCTGNHSMWKPADEDQEEQSNRN